MTIKTAQQSQNLVGKSRNHNNNQIKSVSYKQVQQAWDSVAICNPEICFILKKSFCGNARGNRNATRDVTVTNTFAASSAKDPAVCLCWENC